MAKANKPVTKKDEALGHEKLEPGQASREMDERAAEKSGVDHDAVEIAKQQGTSQRGWTADQPDPDAPPHFDPAHPGGKPAGDPHH